MSMRNRPVLFASSLLAALLLLGGCSDNQIRIAREGLEAAKKAEAVALAALEAVRQNAAEARVLAAQIGGEKGAELVSKVEAALPRVEQGLKAAQEAVAFSEKAVVAAEKEHAAGSGTIDVLKASLLAACGGWAGVIALALRAIGKYKTALSLTAAHADVMEQAEDEDDVAYGKDQARQAQVAAGVFPLIQKARGKAA